MTETRIMLASGNLFDLLEPESSSFTLHDIAWGMAHVCRFSGQVSRFYSVAEHCVHVSKLVPLPWRRAALLHDASEAFIGDVSRPLKALLPDYRAIEARIEVAIWRRILPLLPVDVPAPASIENDQQMDAALQRTATVRACFDAIKAADTAMAAAEAKWLMPAAPADAPDYWNLSVEPDLQARAHALHLWCDPPELAARKWLNAWNRAGHQAATPDHGAKVEGEA